MHRWLGETSDGVHRDRLVAAAIAHDLYQDELLEDFARDVRVKSERDRALLAQFLKRADALGRATERPARGKPGAVS